jgi:hypothetical protein
LARPDLSNIRNNISPLLEERRDKELIVHFGRGLAHLHLIIFVHLTPP